ncbi:hypothetical protein BDF14DRAFT_1742124 [Spinellus fusiger]|nr:hypothetical protein BDF14DRAFT_1742124 [Spinellus fusiger]
MAANQNYNSASILGPIHPTYNKHGFKDSPEDNEAISTSGHGYEHRQDDEHRQDNEHRQEAERKMGKRKDNLHTTENPCPQTSIHKTDIDSPQPSSSNTSPYNILMQKKAAQDPSYGSPAISSNYSTLPTHTPQTINDIAAGADSTGRQQQLFNIHHGSSSAFPISEGAEKKNHGATASVGDKILGVLESLAGKIICNDEMVAKVSEVPTSTISISSWSAIEGIGQ